MKAVILAGGYGTRISEESSVRPKPMVEIGLQPILWHIMKLYSCHGITDFIVACGYKGEVIKHYFSNLFMAMADVTFNLADNSIKVHRHKAEAWTVTCVDTGLSSMTGGRLLRLKEHIGDETFCMTYGDGVANVNITDTIAFHRKKGLLATMTAIKPPGRFGAFALHPDCDQVPEFVEKPQGDGAWINGGFFVLEPEVLKYIKSDTVTWEQEPLKQLCKEGQMAAYRHLGFWQPMDTLRDKMVLEDLWKSGAAPWKIWD